MMFKPSKVSAAPRLEASELEPEPGALVETKQKRKPRIKGTGKGLTINTSGLALTGRKEEQPIPAPDPVSLSVEPVKKSKAKKVIIDTSKLPLFGAKALPAPPQPKQQPNVEEDTGLSDIQEEFEEAL